MRGAAFWCWSSTLQCPVIALVLSGSNCDKLIVNVLVEGRDVVKLKTDLYDSKEGCEAAHNLTEATKDMMMV